MKNKGNRILIKENEVLGTEAIMSTIVEVTDYGYLVIVDDDPEEWVGPIDFDGNLLQTNC